MCTLTVFRRKYSGVSMYTCNRDAYVLKLTSRKECCSNAQQLRLPTSIAAGMLCQFNASCGRLLTVCDLKRVQVEVVETQQCNGIVDFKPQHVCFDKISGFLQRTWLQGPFVCLHDSSSSRCTP